VSIRIDNVNILFSFHAWNKIATNDWFLLELIEEIYLTCIKQLSLSLCQYCNKTMPYLYSTSIKMNMIHRVLFSSNRIAFFYGCVCVNIMWPFPTDAFHSFHSYLCCFVAYARRFISIHSEFIPWTMSYDCSPLSIMTFIYHARWATAIEWIYVYPYETNKSSLFSGRQQLCQQIYSLLMIICLSCYCSLFSID
jgi:hypothetical protein